MVRLVAGRTADLLAGEGERSFVIFRHYEDHARQGRADPEGQHNGAHKHGGSLISPVVDKGRDARRVHEDQD